MKVTATSRSGP